MPGLTNSKLKPVLIFAFWTLVGLSFAGQFFISSAQLGRPIPWHTALAHSLSDWYVFAILSYIPIALTRRFSLGDPFRAQNLLLHIIASGSFSVLFVILRAAVGAMQAQLEHQAIGFTEISRPLLFKTWHFNVMIYWVILSVCHALEFYRRYQERQTHTLELEKLLTEARLEALQMQLNPHFLFNTLHAVSSLMHKDVEAADRMIARLSGLLRYALESTNTQEVTLEDELSFLSEYLEIERIRFGDRLQTEFSIAPDTRSLLVPNLILQPLVENAIRHGIETSSAPGRITIVAKQVDNQLCISVSDLCKTERRSSVEPGVGLSNVRSRLEQLYGSSHEFETEYGTTCGFVNRITIPVRKSSATAKNETEGFH